jgi:hypothetical protein
MKFSLIEVLVRVIVSYFFIFIVIQEHIDTPSIKLFSFFQNLTLVSQILLFLHDLQIVKLMLFHSYIGIYVHS